MNKILAILLVIGLSYTVHAEGVHVNNQAVQACERQTVGETEFKALPYSYDALEPYIDKLTVEIHYSKHHQSYYTKFMAAIKGTEMASMYIEDVFKNVSKYPLAVRNNGGGYYNHMLYWENMKANGGGLPTGRLLSAIQKEFGSFDAFKTQFSDAAKTRFGSGWAWLSVDNNNKLFISSTPNQDNPLMDVVEQKGTPLLVLDVWEHAYYLNYQNKRANYIDAFWKIINWDVVEKRFMKK